MNEWKHTYTYPYTHSMLTTKKIDQKNPEKKINSNVEISIENIIYIRNHKKIK